MSEQGIPPRALALLVVLTLVWGTNWPLFAFAVREISVWTFRAVAVTARRRGAALAVARARGQSLAIPREYWPTVVVATLLLPGVLEHRQHRIRRILNPSRQASVLGLHHAAVVGADLLGGARRKAQRARCGRACCSAVRRCCC